MIHQQDVEPRAPQNRILAPFASSVTVTFTTSTPHFPRGRTTVTGNPVRPEILSSSREAGLRRFELRGDLP